MRRFALIIITLALAATVSACANTSSTVQRNDHFSGMTFAMPIGSAAK